MSVKTIIQEAINKSPVALKEALEEELRARVALALEAKMKDEDEDDEDDEDEDDDSDEDEDDEKCESVEELEAFMESEEYEQLDELDKKTLASYVKKASADAAMKSGKAEYEAGRAHDATYGGESPDHGTASRWRARSDKSSKTASNRLKGVSRATDRLAKESFDLSDFTVEELEAFMESEEYEQIDEISKNTLVSYIKKADRSANKSFSNAIKQQSIANRTGSESADKKRAQHSKDFDKRATGIDRAKARLSKEQIDEISSKTLGKYINKASRDVAKKETERSKLRDQIQKHNFSDWDADAALGHDRETANKLRKARQDAADSMKAQDQKIFNKQWKRETGIHTAIKKLGQRD